MMHGTMSLKFRVLIWLVIYHNFCYHLKLLGRLFHVG